LSFQPSCRTVFPAVSEFVVQGSAGILQELLLDRAMRKLIVLYECLWFQ
jgi:hypothetical protein